jgi:hypothetical protein
MTHDSLCGLSQPCDDEIPEHGYCSMQHGQFCIHCHTWCTCFEVRQAEQRMLAKCIEAVQALFGPEDYKLRVRLGGAAVLAALHRLEEKP